MALRSEVNVFHIASFIYNLGGNMREMDSAFRLQQP